MFECFKKMSPSFRQGCTTLVLTSACLGGGYSVHAEVELLDGVAVIVNDSVVMVSEIEERYESVVANWALSGLSQTPPKEEVVDQILEGLILESIQIQEAGLRGIVVTDEEITNAIREVAQLKYDKSIEEFRDFLVQEGESYNQFRELMYRELLIDKVQRRLLRNRIYISPQDVKDFRQLDYFNILASDRFLVGHILITQDSSNTTTGTERQAHADKLVEQLREGADFAVMAVNHSSASTALEGGDLGWRRAEEIPQLFVEEVLAMEVGDVSDPIRNERGLHIIKLVDKQTLNTDQEQTLVRHILIQPNAIKTEVDAKREIEDIRDRIVNGEDFEELARQYSDDSGSSREGGGLGWISGDTRGLDPIFSEVMNTTEIGELSEVFASAVGWHVVEVLDRKVADVTEQALDNFALNALYNRLFEETKKDWLQEIRAEAFVKVVRNSF